MPNIKEMAKVVIEWYKDTPISVQFQFRTCPYFELIEYHHSLGRDIRNYFKLWEEPWEPELIDGTNYSDKHPDHISLLVIQEAWKIVNKEEQNAL